MSRRSSDQFGDTWVYESIVGAIPGLSLSPRMAVLVQFVGFEAALLLLATVYDLWSAVPAGTVAILVASVGSAFMHDLGSRVRRTAVPVSYRRILFGSSIEVALGVFAYAGLLTYLFVFDVQSGGSLLNDLLGPNPPVGAVYLLLIILWDVTYRIGTGWWAAVAALWRAMYLELDPAVETELRRVDYRTVGFALVQTALLPFIWGHPVLAVAVAGHVLAVVFVIGVAQVLSGQR